MLLAYGQPCMRAYARVVSQITGLPAAWEGEDTRSPAEPYVGLSWGPIAAVHLLSRQASPVVRSGTLTFTIVPATTRVYEVAVLNTRVRIPVLDTHVQADVPALLLEAWTLALLPFNVDGTTGGLLLTTVNDSTFTVTADASYPWGIPQISPGAGMTWTENVTEPRTEVLTRRVDCRLTLRLWGQTRQRGLMRVLALRLHAATQAPWTPGLFASVGATIPSAAEVTWLDEAGLNIPAPRTAVAVQEVAQVDWSLGLLDVQAQEWPALSGVGGAVEWVDHPGEPV